MSHLHDSRGLLTPTVPHCAGKLFLHSAAQTVRLSASQCVPPRWGNNRWQLYDSCRRAQSKSELQGQFSDSWAPDEPMTAQQISWAGAIGSDCGTFLKFFCEQHEILRQTWATHSVSQSSLHWPENPATIYEDGITREIKYRRWRWDIWPGGALCRVRRKFHMKPVFFSKMCWFKNKHEHGLDYRVHHSNVLILNLHRKARHNTSLHHRNGLKIHTSVLPGSASVTFLCARLGPLDQQVCRFCTASHL